MDVSIPDREISVLNIDKISEKSGKSEFFVAGADKTPQDKISQDKMSRQNATQTIRHTDKMSQDKTSHRQNVTGQNVT